MNTSEKNHKPVAATNSQPVRSTEAVPHAPTLGNITDPESRRTVDVFIRILAQEHRRYSTQPDKYGWFLQHVRLVAGELQQMYSGFDSTEFYKRVGVDDADLARAAA